MEVWYCCSTGGLVVVWPNPPNNVSFFGSESGRPGETAQIRMVTPRCKQTTTSEPLFFSVCSLESYDDDDGQHRERACVRASCMASRMFPQNYGPMALAEAITAVELVAGCTGIIRIMVCGVKSRKGGGVCSIIIVIIIDRITFQLSIPLSPSCRCRRLLNS